MMLLTTSHRLGNGLVVRVRFPHRRDRVAVGEFHRRLGLRCDELDLRRLLSFDLRRRRTVVAVAWLDGAETLVGIATTLSLYVEWNSAASVSAVPVMPPSFL